MKVSETTFGRIFMCENVKDEKLLTQFTDALATYDMGTASGLARHKLQNLWQRMEKAVGQELPKSMGIPRDEVFPCFEKED